MIQLAHPQALLLILLLPVAVWFFPALKLLRPLRLITAMLLIAILVNPRMVLKQKGLDLWVLFDKSASAEALVDTRQAEIQTLLERDKTRHDRLFYIDYAEDIAPRETRQTMLYPGRREATRTASALHYTLSRADRRRSSRILLVTDGYSTEPLDQIGARMIEENIPLDIRIPAAGAALDYRVDQIRTPTAVQPGEPFLVEARILGSPDAEIPASLYRGDTLVSSVDITLKRGSGTVKWMDVITEPGAVEYTVAIDPEHDKHPGNNRQSAWVEARGQPRVLLVTGYSDDPVAKILESSGFIVETAGPSDLNHGSLAGVKLLILNNIPAYRLPGQFLNAIPFFVVEQGGGMLMTGGRFSYAAGGYFESPVDELLPVSMELKQEHRKLAVAMAIVMDRSGSMMAGVGGGSGMTKMDLANEGAARAIELLGEHDAVTIFAVDTQPHQIIPLSTVGKQRKKIANTVRLIKSSGGGIFVYSGLSAAWQELKTAKQGQRHIILFSDAADSEEPGNYKALIKEMVEEGTTISVIALGSENDVDAKFLQDIAQRGNGRIIFNEDASTLPAIFAQETVALNRSAFIEEPTTLKPAAGWMEIAASRIDWPDAVDAYNLCYLREGASVSALSGDEYEAPLVAHWTRGMGAVSAITFPVCGEHSQFTRNWIGYAGFLRTLARKLMAPETPAGIGIRTEKQGAWLNVELLYDDTWIERMAVSPPRLVTLSGTEKNPEHIVWRRMGPGRFSATAPLPAGSWLRGVVQIGETALSFGPIASITNPEWQVDRARIEELRQISAASGGQERAHLGDIWNSPVKKVYRDIRIFLLTTIIILFLIDALLTRLNRQMPSWGISFRKEPEQERNNITVRKKPVLPLFRKKPAARHEPDPETSIRRRIFEKARRRR